MEQPQRLLEGSFSKSSRLEATSVLVGEPRRSLRRWDRAGRTAPQEEGQVQSHCSPFSCLWREFLAGAGVICRSPPEPFPGSDHWLCHQRVPLSGEWGVWEALAPRYCWSPCPVCPLAFMSLNRSIPDRWAQRWPFWKPRPGVSFKMASVPPSVASAQPRPHCFPAGRTGSSPGMSVLSQEPLRWSPGPPRGPSSADPSQEALSFQPLILQLGTLRPGTGRLCRPPSAECRDWQNGAVAGLSQRKQGCPSWLCTVHCTSPALASSAGQWGQGQGNLRAGGFLLRATSEVGHFRTDRLRKNSCCSLTLGEGQGRERLAFPVCPQTARPHSGLCLLLVPPTVQTLSRVSAVEPGSTVDSTCQV